MSAVKCKKDLAVVLADRCELGDTYFGRPVDRFGMVDITQFVRFSDKEKWVTEIRQKYGFSEKELFVATLEVALA